MLELKESNNTMIDINNLYHIKKVISLELSNNLKTDLKDLNYRHLMRIQGELNVLIQTMEKDVKRLSK